jgi:hypothetical protein
VLRTFAAALFYPFMKPFFKVTLLFALIISGKLAKEPAPVATAKTVQMKPASDTSVVFVNHLTAAQPVKPVSDKTQPEQSGINLIANLF